MEKLKVAIVILNWNGIKWLKKFLPTLTMRIPSYAHIFVADNNSSDHSVLFLKENYPDITLISLEQNFGYTGGYNRALKQIDARYYVLLNSDIEVSETWIEPIIKQMDSDPDIAACQPKMIDFNRSDFFEYAGACGGFIDFLGYPFCRGRIFDHLEKDLGQYQDAIEVFWATGACLFVRATDFWEVGGFDEDFFAHMEEIDLCWRFKKKGKKVFVCPQSVVHHVGGGTLPKNNPRKTFLNFRNNNILLAKNHNTKKYYFLWFIRVFLDALAATVFLLKGQPKDTLSVIKAQLQFLFFFKKHREAVTFTKNNPSYIYQSSIVLDYFLRKKKCFSQLKPTKFTS